MAYYDRELGEALREKVAAHVARCGSCSEALDQFRILDGMARMVAVEDEVNRESESIDRWPPRETNESA